MPQGQLLPISNLTTQRRSRMQEVGLLAVVMGTSVIALMHGLFFPATNIQPGLLLHAAVVDDLLEIVNQVE